MAPRPRTPVKTPVNPVPIRSRRYDILARSMGLLLLAALIGAFAWHTDRSARAFDAKGIPPETISGMAEPRFFIDNDAYAWMAHTRDLMASGGWRLRHTAMDNAPHGREMHWSHLLIWTMRGMASVIMARTGWPAARAVELAGVWAMPLLQLLILAPALVVLMRKLGWVPAGLFGLLAITLDGLSVGFHPLRPDHHGLQLFATLYSFACLQLGGMGWTRTGPAPATIAGPAAFHPLLMPSHSEARRWFLASGLFGGLALWLGATVWMFSLAVIALAAFSATPMIATTPEADRSYCPGLWRWWAGAGILAGIGFYVLEYAPRHFAMRLEVNHPLHWLYWAGIAEGLRFLASSQTLRFWRNRTCTEWVAVAAALVAVAVLPVLIRFGPNGWHHLNDPLLQRLHAVYIGEFKSGWPAIRAAPIRFFFSSMGILPALALICLGAQAGWKNRPASEFLLRSGLIFAGLYFLLTLFQLRWGYFLAGGLLWIGVLYLPVLSERWPARPWLLPCLAMALAANAAVAAAMRLNAERAAANASRIPPPWAHASLAKRIILQWGLAAGSNTWRMAGMAADAPALYYFSGIQGLASLYWENTEGWQTECAFFNDTAATNARDIAKERTLTHALAPAAKDFASLYLAIENEWPPPAFSRPTLAQRLSQFGSTNLPNWIQFDETLSAAASQTYVIQTPSGLVGHSSPSRVYRLSPNEGSKNESRP